MYVVIFLSWHVSCLLQSDAVSLCPQLELSNVTLAGLWQPAGGGSGNTVNGSSLHGPIHATNVSYVILQNFNCSNVRNAHGWACLLLQYNARNTLSYGVNAGLVPPDSPPLLLSFVNCTFRGNSVTRRGLYGTVNTFSTASPPSDATSVPRGAGLGMVVVMQMDAASTGESAGGSEPSPAGAASSGLAADSDRFENVVGSPRLTVSMMEVTAADNAGGSGTLFTSVNISLVGLA